MKIRINNDSERVFYPEKAMLIYTAPDKSAYVESYDISPSGSPVNPHPLSERECAQLVKSLTPSVRFEGSFLQPSGLIPPNVLYLSWTGRYAVWYTAARRIDLKFTESLGIPSGEASIPPLVWKAGKNSLQLFALRDTKKINEQASLYHAPFFNVFSTGDVCMGTVKVDLPEDTTLEDFMAIWETCFFNSYFSHSMEGHSPTRMNIVQLWQKLIGRKTAFPAEELLKTKLTIKSLLS